MFGLESPLGFPLPSYPAFRSLQGSRETFRILTEKVGTTSRQRAGCEAAGKLPAESIQERRVRGVWAHHAAEAECATVGSREDHIGTLDAVECRGDRARALPLLQRFPADVGQEADEERRWDAVGALRPDGAEPQFARLAADGRLGIGELDIRPPEGLGRPVQVSRSPAGTVGSVPTSLRERPAARGFCPSKRPSGRASRPRPPGRRARVRRAAIGWPNRVWMACAFARRSTERTRTKVSVPSGPGHGFASTPSRTVAPSRASGSARAHFRSSLFGVPTRSRRPVAWSQARVSALTMPRSIPPIRCAIPKIGRAHV